LQNGFVAFDEETAGEIFHVFESAILRAKRRGLYSRRRDRALSGMSSPDGVFVENAESGLVLPNLD
jgi:hypothetical protein